MRSREKSSEKEGVPTHELDLSFADLPGGHKESQIAGCLLATNNCVFFEPAEVDRVLGILLTKVFVLLKVVKVAVGKYRFRSMTSFSKPITMCLMIK